MNAITKEICAGHRWIYFIDPIFKTDFLGIVKNIFMFGDGLLKPFAQHFNQVPHRKLYEAGKSREELNWGHAGEENRSVSEFSLQSNNQSIDILCPLFRAIESKGIISAKANYEEVGFRFFNFWD